MPLLPAHPSDLVDAIDAMYESEHSQKFRLSRIGASQIGDECLRKIYYSWRGYAHTTFSGRMLRIFETGNREEDRIIRDLKLTGLTVYDRDENGEQFTFTDETGHFVCKADGVVLGVPGYYDDKHILEIKTHNAKSFAEMRKKGLRVAKRAHYYQMQAGMALSGIGAGLYVAKCKDDETYHIERVEWDEEAISLIRARVFDLVSSTLTPAGIGENADSYACRWCDYKGVCHEKEQPLRSCRSCENVIVGPEGLWACNLTGETLNNDQQKAACDHYEVKGSGF